MLLSPGGASFDLNLNGVHFAQGIEFTFGNITLPAGAYILVVKNIAAFESRYGPGFNIAGQYVGSLDNGGENLEIQDAVGEKVQDFSYNFGHSQSRMLDDKNTPPN